MLSSEFSDRPTWMVVTFSGSLGPHAAAAARTTMMRRRWVADAMDRSVRFREPGMRHRRIAALQARLAVGGRTDERNIADRGLRLVLDFGFAGRRAAPRRDHEAGTS